MNRCALVVVVVLACASQVDADPLFPLDDSSSGACLSETDFFVGNRVRREFGPSGLLLSEEIDTGRDGRIDEIRTYAYDEHDRVVRVEYVPHALGRLESYDAYFRSADGLTEWRKNVTFNPTVHAGQRRFVLRDRQGREVREVLLTGNPFVVGADRRWEYDDAGRPTRVTDYRYGPSREWQLEWVHHFDHDEYGRVVAQRSDRGGDGTIDEITLYDYDGDGRLIGSVTDTGADGEWDWSFRRTYDDERQVVTEHMDWDLDGEPDVEIVDYFDCGGD